MITDKFSFADKLRKWYIVFSWAVFVFVLLTYPTPGPAGTIQTLYDKVVHTFLFGVFAYLVARAAMPAMPVSKRAKFGVLAAAFLTAVLYSGGGELLQRYVPGRDVNELDFLAGVIGALLGTGVAYVRYRR